MQYVIMLQELVKIFMEAKSYKNGGVLLIFCQKQIPVQNYFLLVTFKNSINLVMEKKYLILNSVP